MINWISVDDCLPEKDTLVLVYRPDAQYAQYGIDEWVDLYETLVSFSSLSVCVGEGWAEDEFNEITHWAFLNPPKKQEL